jgi:predicted GH43/DUF377 family glycosyl hydrolase
VRWKKIGLLFSVNGIAEWMNSHAALPFAKHLEGDIFRIFFSTRDRQNRSHLAFVDIDIRDPKRILQISKKPLLSPGTIGLFDDSGVNACCEVDIQGVNHVYYIGWSLALRTPFHTYCGLAAFNSSTRQYEKVSRVPILDRSEEDPYSIGYLQVRRHNCRFKMWYETSVGWGKSVPQRGYSSVMKYAESLDGMHWDRKGITCIPLQSTEVAISRPSVLITNGRFQMWYSRKRGDKYTLGYATSPDGLNWTRNDREAGIRTSKAGWDSEEIEYPHVFQHHGETYMLYNGNGYGKSGLGLAVLQSKSLYS